MKTMCFLGDSITQHGEWVCEVFENIKNDYIVFNCGIGGDRASRALYRLHETCLSYLPDKMVIMFGMNDIDGGLYSENCKEDNIEAKKKKALDIYRESLTCIMETVIGYGIEVILCTPTPCDDIHYPELGKNDCNTGLSECADFVKELAEKYGCKCVDFFTSVYKYMQKDMVKCPDTVHPDYDSQHVIAQIFMKEAGITDSIDIDTPFVMSDINKHRFETELELKLIEMVEWVFLYEFKIKGDYTVAEKLKEAEKLLEIAEKNGEENYAGWYRNYLAKSGKPKEELKRKLVDYTLKMVRGN